MVDKSKAVKPNESAKPAYSPGEIVLQWLTYAFWGWTVLSLSVLTVIVISYFMNKTDTGGFMPYGIAAVLVLLPISYICDKFYRKKEPEHKTGASMWVMVIHAVVFALFGIGALIAAVISLIMLIVSAGDNTNTQVALYSALIIAVYYALTFIRTLNPPALKRVVKWYGLIMIVSVGIIALLGIVGPLANERLTRNDRLVSDEVNTIANAITSYTNDKNQLPESLNQLDLEDDAKSVVELGLVKYKPEGKFDNVDGTPAVAEPSPAQAKSRAAGGASTGPEEYRYQLCATYTQESSNYTKFKSEAFGYQPEYEIHASTYSHPKGEVCYKLKVDVF